jgi:hypothetical protein
MLEIVKEGSVPVRVGGVFNGGRELYRFQV